MRTSKGLLFFVLSASSAAVVLSVACGGNEAKSPANAAGPAAPATSAQGAASTPAPTGEGMTTTSQFDASDLQGAKLATSNRKEVETTGSSGPKTPRSGHADEPGRKSEDIRTIVMTHRDEARACYDRSLKDHPGIEGDLDVKWTIDPDGNVTDVVVDEAKSQIHEASVGDCVVNVIKKLKFAASQKGFETHASYPFNFHPKSTRGRRDAGH